MANNNAIFNAVVAGAGGAVQERWIQNTDSASYENYQQMIEAIATAVDADIPAGTISQSQQGLMQSICQGVFAGRYPQVDNYEAIAAAIVALYTSLATILQADTGGGLPTSIRADYGFHIGFLTTFADNTLGDVGVVAEPGTYTSVNEGDRVMFPPDSCLVGVFHSADPAPQLGGVYLVVQKLDDQELIVRRVDDMTTTAQIDALVTIGVDSGPGAGLWQVATPAGAVVNTDPQVMPWLSIQPPNDVTQYTLGVQSNLLQWQVGFINAP
jgi:hypothetical protein